MSFIINPIKLLGIRILDKSPKRKKYDKGKKKDLACVRFELWVAFSPDDTALKDHY